jgi:hypothetical protein
MRKYKNVVLSDISKMFLKVILEPADQHYHRFHFNPNSFVLGDLANAVFPPDFPEVTNLDRKLKQQIEVQKNVWKQFFLEFVPLLGPRQKWSQVQENLKVDEVVIELDENQPRGVWRLMRVSKIFPSQDGLVRKVEVTSTDNKTYIRPIAKLIPIVRNKL